MSENVTIPLELFNDLLDAAISAELLFGDLAALERQGMTTGYKKGYPAKNEKRYNGIFLKAEKFL